MNCDHSLTFHDRWDLVISEEHARREALRCKKYMNGFELINMTGCTRQQLTHDGKSSVGTRTVLDHSHSGCEVLSQHCSHKCENELCKDGHLFEMCQCTKCHQLPHDAKQCNHCFDLICGTCFSQSPNCPKCGHECNIIHDKNL